MMVRNLSFAFCLSFLVCLGCGKSEVAQIPAATNEVSLREEAPAATSPPTVVVSQFLDQIRRGGEDTLAGELLTSKAKSELTRIGRTIQPIGSPDAQFSVTRFEHVPGQNDAALVHCLWTEPDGNGGKSEFQVVWATKLEGGQWRISGLAMELEPGQEPVIIDFENGAMMAKMLDSEEAENSAAQPPAQAALPGEGLSR